jgi:predicted enzyme related to lactoylglutathione lyase
MSPEDVSYANNQICHFDISGSDPQDLAVFYSSVFGWAIKDQGPGYSLVETPVPSMGGAILDADDASLILGVAVEDIDATLRNAEAAHGAILMPKTDNGWVTKAQIADPAGNRVTLIQM